MSSEYYRRKQKRGNQTAMLSVLMLLSVSAAMVLTNISVHNLLILKDLIEWLTPVRFVLY